MPLQEVSLGDDRELQAIADSIAKSHKIVLITGAGISTSCGIPDFRSKDGLYNLIPEQNLLPTPPNSAPSTPSRKRKFDDLDDAELPCSQSSISSSGGRRPSTPSSKMRGQDLFHSRVFQNAESTVLFYRFIASLRQKIRDEVRDTSATHKFIRTLRDGGRLMRCYTQNIDGLEAREGLEMSLARGKGNKRRFMKKYYEVPVPQVTKHTDFDGGCEVVQLHGDLERVRCNMCSTSYEWTDELTEIYLEGAAPSCEFCSAKSKRRQETGKRGLAVGSLRPNIVLYGEDHPLNTVITPLIPFDVACQPEVLVIMGTSLKVFGLQKIVRELAKAVHSQKDGKGRVVFVNRTRPAESVWDGIIDDFVAMDCDEWVADLKSRREDLWLRQGELNLKQVKNPELKRKRKSCEKQYDINQPPTKKSKVVVEIPGPRSKLGQDASTKRKLATTTETGAPLTPRHNRGTQWKHKLDMSFSGRNLLSPLAQARRPVASPLSARGTPKRPPFSPMTPVGRRSSSKLNQELRADDMRNNALEIPESDAEKENLVEGDYSDTECEEEATPSRGVMGKRAAMTSAPTAGGGSKHGPTKNDLRTVLAKRFLELGG